MEKVSKIFIFAFIIVIIGSLILGIQIAEKLKTIESLSSKISSHPEFQPIDTELANIKKEYLILLILIVLILLLIIAFGLYINRISKKAGKKEDSQEKIMLEQKERFRRLKDRAERLKKKAYEIEELSEKRKQLLSSLFKIKKPRELKITDILNIKEYKEIFERAVEASEQLRSISEETSILFDSLGGIIKESNVNSNFIQEKIQDIEKVAKMIRKIINQTRLIAFNAAIESSRTTREGKGFNVIVSQIRNLVDEIEETTEEIQDTIKELTDFSSKTVLLSEIALKKQRDGEEISERLSKLAEACFSLSGNSEKFTKELNFYNERYKNLAKEFARNIESIKSEEKNISEIENREKKLLEDILILLKSITEEFPHYE